MGKLAMDNLVLLFIGAILAGLALLKVSLPGFLAFLNPIVYYIALIAVIVFSLVLIWKALMALLGR